MIYINYSSIKIIIEINGKTESYRVNKKMFYQIKDKLVPYRSEGYLPKPVRCIETGEVFASAYKVQNWLYKKGITDNPQSGNFIKKRVRGNRKVRTVCIGNLLKVKNEVL